MNTTTTNEKMIVAVMPVLPTSADLAERLSTLQAEASAALSYAADQIEQARTGAIPLEQSASEANRALVYADEQVRGLQALAEEAHAALAAVASYATEVSTQRDGVVQAYKHAFEHGIIHAYECDACMEDAAVENLAERMLESSPEDVAIGEGELLNERLMLAEDLAREWALDEIAGEGSGTYDRTELLNLVEAAGGIDLDAVDYDAAQITEEQELIKSLAASVDDDDPDLDEDDFDEGDDDEYA